MSNTVAAKPHRETDYHEHDILNIKMTKTNSHCLTISEQVNNLKKIQEKIITF